MAKKTKKQAFTIVELVIVIAVIAILLAIIIPTYSNLVRKANEATALVDAKNFITEMLADILSGDKEAADILVFSKKGNDVFLYGYDASRGVVLPYKVSPLKDFGKNLTVTNGHEFYNQAASFCEAINGTDITKVTGNIDDWRKPEVLNLGVDGEKSTVEELGFDKNTMAVFANYDIVPESFAKKNSGVEEVHVHEWGTPEYTWEIGEIYKCTATRICSATGCNFENGTETETVTATYDVIKEATCTEAGKGKYTATFTKSVFETQTQEITVAMLGHDYSVYEKLNDTNHKVKCSRCGDEKTEPHDGATSCSKCGWKKATVDITLSLDKSTLTLKWGDSATITATVTPAGTTVTWSSDNEAVATVDGGVVKAVGTGTAVITATAGDKTATCTVTVTDKWELKDGLLYRNGEKFTGKNPSNVGENGLYYVDGVLANGTVGGHEFRKGMLVVEDKLIDGKNVTTETNNGTRTTDQTFSLNGIDEKYITNKLVIDITDISIAKYNIDMTAYRVASARAKVPFADLLSKNGWTEEDCKKLVNESARALFEEGNSYKLQSGKFFCYPSDPLNELKMYLPHINLTSDFVAYLNALGYEFTPNTGADSYGANPAIADYIARSTGTGEILPLTFAQYLELKYAKGVEISKSGDSYTAGAPASLVFDEDHIPNSDGAIRVGKFLVALVLDSNGNPYLDQNNTGVTGPYGGKFIVNADNEITGFTETFNMSDITYSKDGNVYTFKHNNGTLTIKISKNANGTTTFAIDSGSKSATAVWTPGVAGSEISVGSDGKLDLSSYNLTGDIYGQLDASQRANFIASVFNTGSGTLNSDYVHCDPAVVEAYIKSMNSLSSIIAEGTNYSYGADGTADITANIKIGEQGTITVKFPESQGSDLLYPNVEIILEKN